MVLRSIIIILIMVFALQKFLQDCSRLSQTLDFSVVCPHHQNGVAECAIQTISLWVRIMLLHVSLHWPDQADLELWPFSVTQK